MGNMNLPLEAEICTSKYGENRGTRIREQELFVYQFTLKEREKLSTPPRKKFVIFRSDIFINFPQNSFSYTSEEHSLDDSRIGMRKVNPRHASSNKVSGRM